MEFPSFPDANGCRQEDFCPSFSTDLRPCVLLAVPLQREGGDLTSVLKSESLLGDHSLLVGYAQKVVESPSSLVPQMLLKV